MEDIGKIRGDIVSLLVLSVLIKQRATRPFDTLTENISYSGQMGRPWFICGNWQQSLLLDLQKLRNTQGLHQSG